MSADPSAVRALLQRTIGAQSDRFSLTLAPSEGEEFFEVSATRGDVQVTASALSALSRGAYHYLKHACSVQVWPTASSPDPPAPKIPQISNLPDFGPTRIAAPNQIRYYLSVCTFGYSTVWWPWERWEQEIDWMALRGINMPLALSGQELIWQRIFRNLDIVDHNIESFFSGPAYLPWHRLGNLDGHMGPLSQAWIDGQATLQHKILNRERELGMTPVVPGFSGFVPPSFADRYPNVKLRSAEPWAGFAPTTYVDPLDPMFVEIGSMFVEEYRREFGPSHHYLCETFAEQLPQIEAGHELEHLRAIGAATWNSLHRADPDCHWVMQGWPFHFGRDFWTTERGEALFEAVPEGRLIVLDQVTEAYEIWRDQPVVREKGWIHCVVHNYGQNTHLHGDLAGFADRAWNALSSPDKGKMLGMGIVPEGIDQNHVVYELLTDLMWAPTKIYMGVWVNEYVASRYGSLNPAALQAWAGLLESIYGKGLARTLRYSWRYRPGDQPILADLHLPSLRKAVDLFLEAAVDLEPSPLFLRDLVDVTKTWLGGIADFALEQALADPSCHAKQESFFNVLLDLDTLLSTRPEHCLSTWLSAAQRAATSPEEANRFERNARALITHWGGPFLFDYAVREWSGLIRDFHFERWQTYFASLASGCPPPDFAEWEANWASTSTTISQAEPEDPVQLVKEFIRRYPEMAKPYTICHDVGLFSLDNPIQIEARTLCRVAVYPMYGQGFKGTYSIEFSEDGAQWQAVHRSSHATCRGARASFEPTIVSHINVIVDRQHGDLNQRFQVLVFTPAIP